MSLYSLPVNDFGLGATLANIVGATSGQLIGGTPSELIAAVDGTVFKTLVIPRSDPIPAVWGYQTAYATYFVVEATRTILQATLQLAGWGSSPTLVAAGGVNSFFAIASNALANQMVEFASSGPQSVLFFGHSLGGSAAQACAQLFPFRSTYNPKVVSFGSPRVGNSTFADSFKEVPNCRWMLSVDPVPLLPPRPAQAPLFWLVLGPLAALQSTAYVQADGGIIINPNNTTTVAAVPQFSGTFGETDLANWLLNGDNTLSNPHGILNYFTNLRNLSQLNPLVAPRLSLIHI